MLTSQNRMQYATMQSAPQAEVQVPQPLQQMAARLADLPAGSQVPPATGTGTDDGKGTQDDPPADGKGQQDDPPADGRGKDEAETDLAKLAADRDKWRSLSRKNEADFKAAEADAQKWREHVQSQKTPEERQAEADAAVVAERDDAVRENALLKLGIKHKLDEDSIQEITELLDGVPADKFGERAERLAERLARQQADGEADKGKPARDTMKGRETPPRGSGTGDFLRDAFTRR